MGRLAAEHNPGFTDLWLDANIFYHLESWVGSTKEPYSTVYLSQIRLYQRHITTCSFKLAGGVDLAPSASSSSKVVKQNAVAQNFVSKIVKAFLDSLYAFLDGMVHLASDESPGSDKKVDATLAKDAVGPATGTNPIALLDLEDPVRVSCQSHEYNSLRSMVIRIPVCCW